MSINSSKPCKLNFQLINHNDYHKISPFLKSQHYRICDYTLGVLHMWHEYLNYSYAICNDMLVISSCLNGNRTFSIPLGNGNKEGALRQIEKYCEEKNIPLNFHGITKEALDILINYFGNRFEIKDLESWGEYFYAYDDLAHLRGKKYHSKRNHINRFKRLYPDYTFKELMLQDIDLIKKFLVEYYDRTNKDHHLFRVEKEMTYNLLDNYDKLSQLGAYIVVDDKVVAFSIGEIQQDILYVHIEKANTDYLGSYAIINNEYLKHFGENKVRYINREEDAGDLGLRQAKKSYYPIEIIKKYSVQEKRKK